jgi:hypothetical protein
MVNIWGYQREGGSTCVGDNAALCSYFPRRFAETDNSKVLTFVVILRWQIAVTVNSFVLSRLRRLYGVTRISHALCRKVICFLKKNLHRRMNRPIINHYVI